MAQVIKALREREIPVVIDADGLFIVTRNLDLVRGNPRCVLTPNKAEFARLAAALDVDLESGRALRWHAFPYPQPSNHLTNIC